MEGLAPYPFFCSLFPISRSWRDGVNAARIPWVAPEYAPESEPRAAPRAVGFDRLARIARAGGIKTALAAEEGRQQQPVAVDEGDEQGFHAGQYSIGSNATRLHKIRGRALIRAG